MTQLIRETAGRSFNHSQISAKIRSGWLKKSDSARTDPLGEFAITSRLPVWEDLRGITQTSFDLRHRKDYLNQRSSRAHRQSLYSPLPVLTNVPQSSRLWALPIEKARLERIAALRSAKSAEWDGESRS